MHKYAQTTAPYMESRDLKIIKDNYELVIKMKEEKIVALTEKIEKMGEKKSDVDR